MVSDPLAEWWVHEVVVERWNGDSAYGDQFDSAVTVTGFYDDSTQYRGGEVIAAGRFAFPRSVPYIPVESRVTLPSTFGTNPDGSPRIYRVVDSAIGDGGGQPTPDHQQIGLL